MKLAGSSRRSAAAVVAVAASVLAAAAPADAQLTNRDGPDTYEFQGRIGNPTAQFSASPNFEIFKQGDSVTPGLASPVTLTMEHIEGSAAAGGYSWIFPFTFEAQARDPQLVPGNVSGVLVNVRPKVPDFDQRSFFGGLGFNATATMNAAFDGPGDDLDFDESFGLPLSLFSMISETKDAPPTQLGTLPVPPTACPEIGIGSLVPKVPFLDAFNFGLCTGFAVRGAPLKADIHVINGHLALGEGYERGGQNNEIARGVQFDGVNPIQLNVVPDGGPITLRFRQFDYRPTLDISYFARLRATKTTVWTSPPISTESHEFPAITSPFPLLNTGPLEIHEGDEPQPKDIDLQLAVTPGISSLTTSPPGRVIYGNEITVTAEVDGDVGTVSSKCDGQPCVSFDWNALSPFAFAPVIDGKATVTTTVPFVVGPGGLQPTLRARINVAVDDGEVSTGKNLRVRVGKRTLSVQGQVMQTSFNAPLPDLTATMSNFAVGDDASDLGGQLTFTTDYERSDDVGQYTYVPGGLTSDNYEFDYRAGRIDVGPRLVKIVAEPVTINYGDPLPDFAFDVLGLGPGDTFDDLGCTVGIGTDATPTSPVGTYTLEPDGPCTSPNFSVTFESAKLTIERAPLTIRPRQIDVRYGDALPAFALDIDGLVAGDGPDALDGAPEFATDAHKGSPPGSYPLTVTGLSSPNYAITYEAGEVVIARAPLTIAVRDVAKRYGAAMPPFGLDYDGFVLDQSPADLLGTPRFTTTADPASHVGTYDVTVAGLSSSNYAITFEPGTLTVLPTPLTIRVRDRAKTYGAPLPAFGLEYDGFVLDDSPADLQGSPSFTTDATQGSGVGTYEVRVTGLRSPDYDIAFASGTLNVLRAPLTVRAEDLEAQYSDPAAPQVAYDGFVLDQGPDVLGGALVLDTPRTRTSPPAEYPIVPSGLTSPNYAISFVDGTLRVIAEDARATYTGARHAGTASPSSDRATVTLAATVRDISAVPGAAEHDEHAGDVRGATVSFVDRATGATLCTGPVGLVRTTDTRTGTATCSWRTSLGEDEQRGVDVGVVAGGSYDRDSADDDGRVEVGRPAAIESLTCLCSVEVADSGGLRAADAGSRLGVMASLTRAGDVLAGGATVRLRSGGRTYEVRAAAPSSLGVDGLDAVTVNADAQLVDVTNLLAPQVVDGSAVLQLELRRSLRTVAVTVWRRAGGLWLAGRWDGHRTVDQPLAGGAVGLQVG